MTTLYYINKLRIRFMVEHIFSWKEQMVLAQDIKVRRAHSMIITNPTFRKEHPDWARDAEKKQYTIMDKTIREQTKKRQEEAFARRVKFFGKD